MAKRVIIVALTFVPVVTILAVLVGIGMNPINSVEGVMSKYDSLKYWAKVKARTIHKYHRCARIIKAGDLYYREKIDFVNPPPGYVFAELCQQCGEQANDAV